MTPMSRTDVPEDLLDEPCYTPKHVAAILGRSVRSVYAAIRRGEVAALRVNDGPNAAIRITPWEVQRLVVDNLEAVERLEQIRASR